MTFHKSTFVAELARTGRICDALELVGANYAAYYRQRALDGSFAAACDSARAEWCAANAELARLERGAALVRYQQRHSQRLSELKREGHAHWQRQNPERVAEIARKAGAATRAKVFVELPPKRIARAERLLGRFGYRRVAYMLGVSPSTLHRRIKEARDERDRAEAAGLVGPVTAEAAE